jgi:hypothetical protein
MMGRPLLFITDQTSLHAARWMSLAAAQGWQVHLFATGNGRVSPELKDVTLHWPLLPHLPVPGLPIPRPVMREPLNRIARARRAARLALSDPGWAFQRVVGGPSASIERLAAENAQLRRANEGVRIATFEPVDPLEPFGAASLARLINDIQPAVLHSIGLVAGQIVLDARKKHATALPGWVATLAALYADADHDRMARGIRPAADVVVLDRGNTTDKASDRAADPYFGMFVGFDPDSIRALRDTPPSQRKTIVVVLDDAPSAGLASRVLARAANELSPFEVLVYSSSLRKTLQGEIVGRSRPARWLCDLDMLADLGRARLAIGFDVADRDGLPIAEAMSIGAFPIEVGATGVNAWLTRSQRGLAVSAADIQTAAARLASALTDDGLVDRAAAMNISYIDTTYAPVTVSKRLQQLYEDLAAEGRA